MLLKDKYDYTQTNSTLNNTVCSSTELKKIKTNKSKNIQNLSPNIKSYNEHINNNKSSNKKDVHIKTSHKYKPKFRLAAFNSYINILVKDIK